MSQDDKGNMLLAKAQAGDKTAVEALLHVKADIHATDSVRRVLCACACACRKKPVHVRACVSVNKSKTVVVAVAVVIAGVAVRSSIRSGSSGSRSSSRH